MACRAGFRRAAGAQLAGQLARMDLDQAFAALDRHAHDGAFLVEQLGLGRRADELYVVPAEEQLGREQRAVRSAEDQDVMTSFHDVKLSPALWKARVPSADFGCNRRCRNFMLRCVIPVRRILLPSSKELCAP